jgi:hypothetical protein
MSNDYVLDVGEMLEFIFVSALTTEAQDQGL